MSTSADEPESRPGGRSYEQSWRRGFWSLWVTQFQGAFSDNVHKMLITFPIPGLHLPKKEEDWLVLWTGVLFALPFILFSMTGGWLANRYSKRTVTIGVEVLEIAVMARLWPAPVAGRPSG